MILKVKRRTIAAIFTAWFAICATSLSAAQDDSYRAFFAQLQKRLTADGFDAERIRQLYQKEEVRFETRGVGLYFVHNEATLDYDSMTHSKWIRQGRQYLRDHAQEMDKAQKEFGVDPKIITAIILVETKFGRNLGSRSILNTLSTMAVLIETQPREHLWQQLPPKRRLDREDYDQKADQKASWAYKELKAFLRYTADHAMDPIAINGSYAGAMGIAQFMPSNILKFGQDGNQDGRINLFDDADAIISIASYLKHYGWQPGISRDKAFKVIFHYNHSKYYVNTILKIADLLKG